MGATLEASIEAQHRAQRSLGEHLATSEPAAALGFDVRAGWPLEVQSVVGDDDAVTVFRLASLAWFAGGVARPLMFLTDAFGYGTAPGSSLAASTLGAALGLAVGAFLWLRPGRPSAIAGVLFGFYAVPSLLNAQILGTPGWFIVLASLGIVAFILSAACLWQTRRTEAV